jgi:hypothetical protein
MGFSPCGMFFEDPTQIPAFFRSLFSRAARRQIIKDGLYKQRKTSIQAGLVTRARLQSCRKTLDKKDGLQPLRDVFRGFHANSALFPQPLQSGRKTPDKKGWPLQAAEKLNSGRSCNKGTTSVGPQDA